MNFEKDNKLVTNFWDSLKNKQEITLAELLDLVIINVCGIFWNSYHVISILIEHEER